MTCNSCGTHMYFSDIDTCFKCQKHQRKVEAIRRHYQRLRRFDLNYAVIQCHWGKGLSRRDTAFVLNKSIDRIDIEIDRAKQNAR